MKGKYHVRLENRRLIYDFEVKRNITVIRGNSATGKTTFISMLESYERDGEESGISLYSEKNCTVLTDVRWKENLTSIRDSLVFIDEDYGFVRSEDFASAIRYSDNYYILITRDNLENLPYSVDEIYGIRTSGKYAGLKKAYHEFYRIYQNAAEEKPGNRTPVRIVTEDSNAGNDFFTAVADRDIPCVSAGGKSNIYREIISHPEALHLVIADGAAFGPEMERLTQLSRSGYQMILYLPESFEWLILSSGLIDDSEVTSVLEKPENYADSIRYFSWEQFFTAWLIDRTKDSYQHYSKSKLNPVFLHIREKKAILNKIPDAARQFLS